MKLPAIKSIAEQFTLQQLQQAEEKLLNEETPDIDIPGDDDGEKLTHVLAAIDILNRVAHEGCDLRTAIRQFSERVRNSIS
jgi:hypothetical protein